MAIFGKDVHTLQDLFIEQVKDLYSSEQQVETAYEKWEGRVENTDLKNLLNDRIQHARTRQDRLTDIANRLEVEPTGHKCKGTEGLIKEGSDFLGDAERNPVRDAGIIANTQRVEHYGIAGYGCAKTYARLLGHADVANTLDRFADEGRQFDRRMTELAELVLNREAALVD